MRTFNSSIFVFLILILPTFLLSACLEEPRVIAVSSRSGAWLGVQLGDLSKKMLENLNLDSGIKIIKVFKDSPAEKAGLEEEDILISFDGETIENSEELVDLVCDHQIGDEVEIIYYRAGEKYTTKATIGETTKHTSGYLIKRKAPRDYFIYHQDRTWLGVNTENLTDQLKDYFAAPEDQGVLITNVFEESPAQNAGLRAGDVIIKVADKKINNTYDLIRAINYFDPEDKVEIIVIREKKEIYFKVKLGKKNKSDNYYRYGLSPEELRIEIPDIDIEIPDIEIEIDADELEILQEEFEEDIKIKSRELENKLKSLNNKLKQLRIKIRNWDSTVT